MKFIYTAILFALLLMPGLAQEFNCQVRLNAPKLQTTDPQVLDELETAIREFFNNQAFTTDAFEAHEQIDVNLQLTITEELGSNSFKADLALQSIRPIYGSTYESPVFTHVDKDISFTFEPSQPLRYSTQTFTDDLSAILTFYAYIMLGLDYDSFSPSGGDRYLQIAQNIVNLVPTANANKNPGWRSLGNRINRYWLIENLLSPKARAYREALYTYHRESLDVMYENPEAGRARMLEALEDIEQVDRLYPNSMVVQLFSTAKSDEIIEIFKPGGATERLKVYNIMSKIDAANVARYRAIR
jgi:hypothetical protein